MTILPAGWPARVFTDIPPLQHILLKGSVKIRPKPLRKKPAVLTWRNKPNLRGNMSQNKQGTLPEVNFCTFIISLGSAALVGLGEVPDPATGTKSCDLELARHNIDLLEMLRQKTVHGLNEQESAMLTSLLYELRLKYVLKREG